MNKITLILGGARSGKSSYALCLAKKHKKVAFIATCQGLDKEMRERISLHKQARPKHWETFEEPREICPLLKKMANGFDCIILDCLTLLVSNLLLAGGNQKTIEEKIKQILVSLKKKKAKVIIVSNEVGLGVVPVSKPGREFRDITGRLNQLVASYADEAFFIVAGLPLKIKTPLAESRGLASDSQSHWPPGRGLASDSQSHWPPGRGLASDSQSQKKE